MYVRKRPAVCNYSILFHIKNKTSYVHNSVKLFGMREWIKIYIIYCKVFSLLDKLNYM